MDSQKNHAGASVDDILEEIKGSGRPKVVPGSVAVDDILNELGVAPKEAYRTALPKKEAFPSSIEPSAAQKQKQEQSAHGKKTSVEPAQQAGDAQPEEEAPVAIPKEREAPSRKPKANDLGNTTILDIEVSQTVQMKRVGKAAALDKVDHNKYSGDTELLSWFSGEEDAPSPKEQKKLERQRRKEQAADERAARRAEKKQKKDDRWPEDGADDESYNFEQAVKSLKADVDARREQDGEQSELARLARLVLPAEKQEPAAGKEANPDAHSQAGRPNTPAAEGLPLKEQPQDLFAKPATSGPVFDTEEILAQVRERADLHEAKKKTVETAVVNPAPAYNTQEEAQQLSGQWVQEPAEEQGSEVSASSAEAWWEGEIPEAVDNAGQEQVFSAAEPDDLLENEVAPLSFGGVSYNDAPNGFEQAPEDKSGEYQPEYDSAIASTSAVPAAPVAQVPFAEQEDGTDGAFGAAGEAHSGTREFYVPLEEERAFKYDSGNNPFATGPFAGTATQEFAAQMTPSNAEATEVGYASGETGAAPVEEYPAEAYESYDDPEGGSELHETKSYDLSNISTEEKVPTAAYTQEFEAQPGDEASKSLYVDEMVDDRFRAFFGESVALDSEELEKSSRFGRKKGKTRSSLFTGEFAQLEQQAAKAEQKAEEKPKEMEGDYNKPTDAVNVERDLNALRRSLTLRLIGTGIVTLLLFWATLAFAGAMPIPGFVSPVDSPVAFSVLYLVLVAGSIACNFTTVAAGLVGLGRQQTVDTGPALAAVGALLQSIVLFSNALSETPVAVTLFGAVAALILGFNTLGKLLRAKTIAANFQLASAGFDHSAAYIVDGGSQHQLAFDITNGLEEPEPVLLVSRPTALVKGFLRQSFSQRWSDGIGRILGWALSGAALVIAIISYVVSGGLVAALSSLAATLCLAAPFTSTLVSSIPSLLMQQGNAKVGAVVPGWSAIEELGQVNVVMAGARDILPPSSVQLRGIKTFQKERIDLAILYAASVLIEGCDTLRDIFLGVIQGKNDMLYKVESLTEEPGRGFTAWVENQRVVIGTREILQRHDIVPPSIEAEMQYTTGGCLPVYLAVSGKLFAMFVIRYTPDEEVAETLEGLVNSGMSLLVSSKDMNVSAELIQQLYDLPQGVVKVLGQRELDLLEPLTNYLPESEGVMTHIGTFTSFIGGMRSAASCAAGERMSVIVQVASVAMAVLICLLMAFSGGLSTLSLLIAVLYQLGWSVLISVLPFLRRY